MRWNIPCAGCGQTVQVSEALVGRPLRCPGCGVRVTAAPADATPAAPKVEAAPRPARRRWLWPAAGVAALLVVGTAVAVAYAPWRKPEPPPGRPFGTMPMELSSVTAGSGRAAERMAGLHIGPSITGVEATLALGDPSPSANYRLPITDLGGVPALAAAGQIPTHLAVALDAKAGRVVVATRDGLLRVFDPADWRERHACRLDKPAYLLQIDPARRRLYAACSAAPPRLNELGERDGNDRAQASNEVRAYDLDAVLRADAAGPLRRVEVGLPLDVLQLSEDGAKLYYLATATNSTCPIGKVDTATWAHEASLRVAAPGPGLMCLVPGGKKLYAMASGRLQLVDLARWEVEREYGISPSTKAMAADSRGRVYLVERSHGVEVRVVDLAAKVTLARWSAAVDGRPFLVLSPDSTRLYLGTSAFAAGRVWALKLDGPSIEQPVIVGQAGSARGRLLRGGLSLTSDGRHLLTSTGQVFRLPS